MSRRIVVTVSSDGVISAETAGFSGDGCLDYIALLEDLTAARTVESSYTSEYATRTETVVERREVTDVDHA